MAKAPVGPTAGRRQAGKPAVAHASIQAAHAPRTLPGAMSIPIEQIAPDPDQPRRAMDDEGLRALAASLMEYGVLQPLLVREAGYLADERARYRIIAGGRRYAAALLAGLARLPVVVKDTEGAALRVTQLVENVQRQDLTPLDEARAFQELMDAEALSAEGLGKRLHISGQQVRTRLQLLSDQVIADAVQRAQIPPTVAREIIRLPDTEEKAEVRAQVEAGQRVTHNDLREIKERHAAAGVANPRSKGGGRPSRTADDRGQGSGDRVQGERQPARYQPMVDVRAPSEGAAAAYEVTDTAAPPVPAPEVDAHFQRALGRVDGPALEVVLLHGVERGWSCQELLRVIREGR